MCFVIKIFSSHLNNSHIATDRMLRFRQHTYVSQCLYVALFKQRSSAKLSIFGLTCIFVSLGDCKLFFWFNTRVHGRFGVICQRKIHSPYCTLCFSVCNNSNSLFCVYSLVNPSAKSSLERLNPMYDISRHLHPSRAAQMSKIILFQLVRVPSLIMSNRDLESVSCCLGTGWHTTSWAWKRRSMTSPNKSANTITSTDNTDLAPQLQKIIGMAAQLSSISSITLPSSDIRSWLFANAALEYPIIRMLVVSRDENFRDVTLT